MRVHWSRRYWNNSLIPATSLSSAGKRGDLIKLLWFDGDGLCLFQKRLERGRFIWPQAESGTVALTRAQLSMLLEGIDWRQPRRTWEPPMAG
jgi:transposase